MSRRVPAVELAGAVDLHVHGAPDVVPRRHTDVELALRAKAAGMAAIVLKSHHESTVGRAALASAASGFPVYGGVVLNRFVTGGLQPEVVEASLELGARVVWLPTLSSTAHSAEFGDTGLGWTDPKREPAVPPAHLAPVSLGGADARLALTEICRLVAAADAVLCSGHVGEAEILLAGRLAERAGARFVVTHPEYRVPSLSPERQQALAVALPLAFFERCAYVISPAARSKVSATLVAEGIRATGGALRNLISSDAGQPANPDYPEGLHGFGGGLLSVGIAPVELAAMMRDTPRQVLGLP